MKNLQTAITARIKTDSAGATLSGLLAGGFHVIRAPHDTKEPYLVLSFVGGGSAIQTNSSVYDEVGLQFSVFVGENGLDTGYAVRDALVALFAIRPLNLSSGRVLGLYRRGPGQVIPDPDGGYQIVVEYGVTAYGP